MVEKTFTAMESSRVDGLYEGMEKGLEKGRAEGLAEGEAKGRAEAKLSMAKALLDQGVEVEIIIRTTGLMAAEIMSN